MSRENQQKSEALKTVDSLHTAWKQHRGSMVEQLRAKRHAEIEASKRRVQHDRPPLSKELLAEVVVATARQRPLGDCLEAQFRSRRGYPTLWYDHHCFVAHHLVNEVWYGPLEPWEVSVHTCGNPDCVNPEHLTRGAQFAQRKPPVKTGHHYNTGARHPRARLSEDDVREIRRLLDTGTLTQRQIALHYGVSDQTVSSIKARTTWQHVEQD